jgi:ATP-dependent helicase/nuclease subunit A
MNWTKNQQRIVDFQSGDLLVAAGAGSGKTAVLTAHIVEKITNPEHSIDLDRLLVVTFTNAAAAEMKERVRKNLEERLTEQPGDENLIRQIGLIPGADISTIHSFCLKLIREQFFRLDLDPGFRLGDPGELQLMQADLLEEIFEEQYEQQEQSFLNFRDMYAKGMRDEQVSALILKLYEYAQSYPYPDQWLDQAAEDQEGWTAELLEGLRQQTEGLLEQLQEAIGMAVDAHIPAKMISALQEDANGLIFLNRQEELAGYCKALSEMTFVRKPSLNKQEKQDALGAADSIDKAFAVRDAVKSAVRKLQETYGTCSQERVDFEKEETAPMQQEMVRLVRLFSERFAQQKRNLGICDFSDLEHMALQILYDAQGHPTDAADTYAHGYDEILIDEYQDCNLVQEQILFAVSKRRFGEENCFMVGDVKQSIYGFRQARPDLFLDKYNTYSEEETARRQKIELSTNFRSRSGVLQAINMIFRQIMTKSLGGISYDDHAALNPGAAFPEREQAPADMELMLLDLSDENQENEDDEHTPDGTEEDAQEELPDASGYNHLEHEARMVAGRIHQLVDPAHPLMVYDGAVKDMRPARYKDIVILMRSLVSTQEDYVRILKEMGIPVYVENESGYFTSVEVANVLDYLRVLDNPMQDIPLAAVMRSPFGNFDAEELAKIRLIGAGKGHAQTFYACCMAARNDIEKLDKFFFGLEQYRRLAQILPIHELLLRILEETGYRYYVGALPNGKKRLLNLDMLVAKARSYEETSYRGLFHFIRYIDRLKRYDVDVQTAGIDEQEVDAVRIMTIHKSKGLEFPVVFLCNMNGQFNRMDLNASVLLDSRYGIAADIRNAKYRYRMKTLKKAALRQKQLKGLLEEEMRVLYVAMTRAKELLIITGGVKKLEKAMERWDDAAQRGRETLPLRVLCAANSYLDWIVPAVFAAEKSHKSYEHASLLDFTKAVLETERYVLNMKRFSKDMLSDWTAPPAPAEEQHTADLQQSLSRILSWSYPEEALTTVHAAMSVSELKHASMEEEGIVPVAVKRPQDGGGAERGTAYHRVLELLDFAGVPIEQDRGMKRKFVSEALDRMVEHGGISREDVQQVDVGDIAAFLETPLAARMCLAARRGALHREQPFLLGVPATEFAPEAGDEKQLVLVRGIIDSYFEEDGDVILVDYKTDRVGQQTGVRVLTERYKAQLVYYKRALQASQKKNVKQAYLYSFTLGKEIEVLL